MAVTAPTVYSDVRVFILGEGPGESEDIQGTPFVGSTGQLLRSNLPDGWADKAWWGNVVRCRPPGNRDPSEPEIMCCGNYLDADLVAIKPHVILAVGKIALDYFWPRASITTHRGLPFPAKLADGTWVWVYSILHPSYVARAKTQDNKNPVLPLFAGDIRRFFSSITDFLVAPAIPEPPLARFDPLQPNKPYIQLPNSLEEVQRLFLQLKPPFGTDFETFKLKPYQRDARMLTAACSDGITTFAWPVNWRKSDPNSWGMQALRWCFTTGILILRAHWREQGLVASDWIAHNASFELAWIWYNCDEIDQRFEDTQGKPRMLYGRKTTTSLADQTRLKLGRDIKELAGITTPGLEHYNFDVVDLSSYPLEDVLRYNALDAWGSWELNGRYELGPADQSCYERALSSTKSTVAMELWGLEVDLNVTADLKVLLSKRQQGYEAQARLLPEVQRFGRDQGRPLSLSAPEDIGNCLVLYYGVELPKTGSNKYSTDEDDLKAFTATCKLVEITLDYREVSKLLSTYVEPLLMGKLIGVDGLLHPNYTVLLTFTGRLSSTDPNIQNFPKRKNREIRKQIVAGTGHVLASLDFGQIEARAACMAARDVNLQASFVNHEDIHSEWLNNCLDIFPDYLNRLATKTGQKEEAKIRKAGRDIIKTDFVFASFYGSVSASVAKRTMIPQKLTDQLLDRFWKKYWGVKQWVDGQFHFYYANGYVELLTGMRRNELMGGNEPINTVLQGTATGHMVLEAQNALWRRAFAQGEYRDQKPDLYFLPRINIHDDLTFRLPEDSRLEWYLDEIGKEMCKPRFTFVTCPLMVEAKVGYDWADFYETGKYEGQYYNLQGELVGALQRAGPGKNDPWVTLA